VLAVTWETYENSRSSTGFFKYIAKLFSRFLNWLAEMALRYTIPTFGMESIGYFGLRLFHVHFSTSILFLSAIGLCLWYEYMRIQVFSLTGKYETALNDARRNAFVLLYSKYGENLEGMLNDPYAHRSLTPEQASILHRNTREDITDIIREAAAAAVSRMRTIEELERNLKSFRS